MPAPSSTARPVEAARLLLIGVMVALFFSPPVTVLLELSLFGLMLAFAPLRARLWRALHQPLASLALAFWVVVALGLLYSEAPWPQSFDIWVSWRRILLLVVAVALFDEPGAKRQLVWTLVVLAAGCALASYAGVLFDFTYYKYDPGIVVRNHAAQGMFFAVAAFASILLLRVETRFAARLSLGIAAALLAGNAVFVTTGRSGHLVVAVLAVALAWSWPGKTPWKRLAWAAGAVVLALAVLASSPVVRERLAQGVDEVLTYREKTEGFTSMGLRVIFLRNTLELIAERPVIGYGTGAFEAAYNRKVQGRPGMEGMPSHDPHNQFLKIAAEHGLLGLAVFLALLAGAFLQRGVPPPYRLLGLGVLAAWCATSLFNSHFSTFAEGRFIWLWLGACLAASPVDLKSPISQWPRRTERRVALPLHSMSTLSVLGKGGLLVACGIAWPGVAFAYIDPGTGAMLVQGLLALVAALVFYFRNPAVLWGDFKGLVRRVGARMFGRQSRADGGEGK